MTGKTILHYNITEELGRGGMGVVYKAEDTRLKRAVAIKFLPRQIAASAEERERFKIEAQAAAALNHPNLATIHAIEAHDDEMFIVMECLDGKELRKIIASDGRPLLQLDQIINLATQIAEGLKAAHAKGIIHRDIKSSNIMVTESGQVKIMDFGLAKIAGGAQLTKEHSTLGTVAYMSPEQARGEPVDHRTDIWSFGVVLYEMLTGQLPFRSDLEQAVIYAIMNHEPAPLTQFRADTPPGLVTIVDNLLKKDPSARYQIMENVLAALKTSLGSAWLEPQFDSPGEPATSPSIAVLPFIDMSPQQDQEFFCEGMAEELITALSKIADLRVVARTSAFAFRGKELDVRKIGQQLNVQYLLEGSVRKAGNKLRIATQLIDVSDGYQLWSERYDRELEDVFAIQDEIARAIVKMLELKLAKTTPSKLVKHYTDNPEAYDLYLKGQYFWNMRQEGGLRNAMKLFEAAIKLDPGYALPYSGLADCYNTLGWYVFLAPPAAFPQARQAAERALQIDDQLAEAHTSLGFVKWAHDWQWQEAEKAFDTAIAISPNYARTRMWYSNFLNAMGRRQESIAEIEYAQSLEPLSLLFKACGGMMYYCNHRYEQAMQQCRMALDVDPEHALAQLVLLWTYEQKSMFEEAIALGQEVKKYTGSQIVTASVARVYALAGKRAEAQQLLRQLQGSSQRRYISSYYVAAVHAALNESEQALAELEKAYQTRDCWLVNLNVDPKFDTLRSDGRFEALLRKIGFQA